MDLNNTKNRQLFFLYLTWLSLKNNRLTERGENGLVSNRRFSFNFTVREVYLLPYVDRNPTHHLLPFSRCRPIHEQVHIIILVWDVKKSLIFFALACAPAFHLGSISPTCLRVAFTRVVPKHGKWRMTWLPFWRFWYLKA